MALVKECPKCRRNKVVDTCCGGYCYECLDGQYPELQHKPTCPTVIRQAQKKAAHIVRLHKMFMCEQKKLIEASNNCAALMAALRAIDPCSACHNLPHLIGNCEVCNGNGFNNSKVALEIIKKPNPPATY